MARVESPRRSRRSPLGGRWARPQPGSSSSAATAASAAPRRVSAWPVSSSPAASAKSQARGIKSSARRPCAVSRSSPARVFHTAPAWSGKSAGTSTPSAASAAVRRISSRRWVNTRPPVGIVLYSSRVPEGSRIGIGTGITPPSATKTTVTPARRRARAAAWTSESESWASPSVKTTMARAPPSLAAPRSCSPCSSTEDSSVPPSLATSGSSASSCKETAPSSRVSGVRM